MAILKDFYAELLHVRIFDTRKAMGDCAGREAAACMKALLAEKETINVMFAAAPSERNACRAVRRSRYRLVARKRFPHG